MTETTRPAYLLGIFFVASTWAATTVYTAEATNRAPLATPRSTVDLTGPWLFLPDRGNEGVQSRYFAKDLDTSGWRHTRVPIAFDQCGIDMTRYQGAGWFRRSINVPRELEDRRVVLHFEAVNYNASVWLNGELVARNGDAFLPFDIPVSDRLRYGHDNTIVVRVDNIRDRAQCQFPLFEGWFGQGGILREVSLVATDPVHVDTVRVNAEPKGASGALTLRATIRNEGEEPATSILLVAVEDDTGLRVARLSSRPRSLRPGEQADVSINETVDGIAAWSPERPVLYTARVRLVEGARLVDEVATRFGFRRVEATGGRLLLNGEPVFLKGFNRHEDSPRTGMAVDLDQARADLEDMKRIGANFVRLCHYPHHPGELDLCDELGMLVMIENAMNEWGHGHFVPTPQEAPIVVENGKRTLEKMIRRDANHPSVIICSVGNESAEERPDVRAGNSELIEYGKTLDPTRLWTHVSNSYRKAEYTPEFYRSDDILAVNAYAVHWLNPSPEEFEAGFPRQTEWLRDQFEKLHRDFPDKPIIIGECGWPMDGRDEWQSRAVIAEFRAADAPYMAGVTFWCYAHHPWPPEIGPMSPYGYVSRDRKTRYKAFYTIERLFRDQARPESFR